MLRLIFTLFFFCSSCATISPWKLDAIAAADPEYSSSRLTYYGTGHAPFHLEFLRVGSAVSLFLNQTQFPIASPDSSTASVRIQLGDDTPFDQLISMHEGRMRLRFPEETTQKITKALQDGQKVTILVDGFEGAIAPEHFSKFYEKLQGSTAFIHNPFKGPIE
jgi:hypothetical protein